MNICEPALDAVVVEGQAFVIETEQVQHGGVEIMPAYRVDGGAVSRLVALPKAIPGLSPAPASQTVNPALL